MAQFTLPKNSKVTKGHKFEAPENAKSVKTFKVYRWDPDHSETPRMDEYDLDTEEWCLMHLSKLKMKLIAR